MRILKTEKFSENFETKFQKSLKIKFLEVAKYGRKPDMQHYSCEKEFYLNNRSESVKVSLKVAQF